MKSVAHVCKQGHLWTARMDFSDDGALYPDPVEAVCAVCFTLGAAQHSFPVAYVYCPSCLAPFYVQLDAVSHPALLGLGRRLPTIIPSVCQSCASRVTLPLIDLTVTARQRARQRRNT